MGVRYLINLSLCSHAYNQLLTKYIWEAVSVPCDKLSECSLLGENARAKLAYTRKLTFEESADENTDERICQIMQGCNLSTINIYYEMESLSNKVAYGIRKCSDLIELNLNGSCVSKQFICIICKSLLMLESLDLSCISADPDIDCECDPEHSFFLPIIGLVQLQKLNLIPVV